MYWPEYNIRPRRKARRVPALVFGVLLGLAGIVLLDGRWRNLLPGGDGGTGPGPISAETSLPTPIGSSASPRAAAIPTAATKSSAGGGPAATAVSGGAEIGPVPGETVALAEPAPDFTLPDLLEEETNYTLSGYRGRPVILNFWASWCVPCRREMPALQATAARYSGDGLLLLGMNQTYLDDVEAARAFVEELGLTFPNTRDENGAVGGDAYQIVGIPTTVFIDREGEVAHIQIGEMSLEQITTYTERLIVGEPLQS